MTPCFQNARDTYWVAGPCQCSVNHHRDSRGSRRVVISQAIACAQVDWPLSVVVSRRAVQQYQLAFRHLAELKWAERDLTGVWQVYQATRALCRCVLLGIAS